MQNVARGAAGAGLIILVVALCYRALLLPAAPDAVYPWASDTLGHVLKTEYMQRELQAGVPYPDFMPYWYVGLEMLRYHAPLPYYILVGLSLIFGSAVRAANWFIALCALAGALGWLPYRRWLGWLPTVAGGALYAFLPDNIRVALAEGNLPRVLATALIPWIVYFLLRSLEESGVRWHRLGVTIGFMLVALSHAMMAAIYAACCILLCIFLWIGRTTNARRMVMGIAAIVMGLLLAGWWLLPSLVGGITGLNAAAMTEALAVFPITTYLNPFIRAGDPEIVYPGAVLLATAVGLLFLRHGRDSQTVALTAVGLAGVLITTPGFNHVFNALPFHHLFWPLRSLGFASFCLLLAVVWRLRHWWGWPRWAMVLSVLLLCLLIADGALSLRLIHLRPARPEVVQVAGRLAQLRGWREATLDYSRLGSAPSYFFTAVGGREQLYGWAYQGARIARNVSAIDEALQQGYTDYVINRLNMFGVDDVARLKTVPMAGDLSVKLQAADFSPVYDGREITLYHRDGGPRALRVRWRALGIGRGAQNLAYIFPQIVMGRSERVDDYTLEELSAYKTLVLAGFSWRDRRRAEELIQQVAQAGVRVLVDLTGATENPLARQPRFLDVWGESLVFGQEAVRLEGDGRSYQLHPFSPQFSGWRAHAPQGLDHEVLTFPYFGMTSAALGYKEYGGGQVWFVGLNLPYHAVLTKDPVVIGLLSHILELPAGAADLYQTVPLMNYTVSSRGYRFEYSLEQDDELLFPAACHDGTTVWIDGVPAQQTSFENLVAFHAPAGRHLVEVIIQRPPIYVAGFAITAIALAGLWVGALAFRERPRLEEKEEDEAGGSE